MPAVEKYIYMMVSDDKYELPLCIADSAQELADKVGVSRNAITAHICRSKKGQVKKIRYLRIKKETL